MTILLTEDYEGNSGNVWADIVAPLATLDDQATPPAGLTGSGTYCLRSSSPNAADDGAFQIAYFESDQETTYLRMHVYVSAEGLNDGQSCFIGTAFNSTFSQVAYGFYLIQIAGTAYLGFTYISDGSAQYPTSVALTLNQWYQLECKYDKAAGEWEWRIDGVSQGSGTLTGVTAAVEVLAMGVLSHNGSAATTVDIDLVEVRDNIWPFYGTYQEYIETLLANIYTPLDGNSTNIGSSTLTTQSPTNVDVTYPATPITKDSTYAARFDNTDGHLNYQDSPDINTGGPWFRRTYSVWATSDDFDANYSIFSEGGSVRNMTLMFGLGGVPVYIADNDSDSQAGCPWSQAVTGPKLNPNEPYHIGMVWESDRSDTGPEGKNRSFVRGYLNGRFVGEKEIYKWDNNLNEEILTEPGGQLNAHSGDIEYGGIRSIIVSKQVFSTAGLNGLMAHNAVWDGVLLTDDDMWELFSRAALPITATCSFVNIPVGSEVRLYEGQTELGGVETSVSDTLDVNYTVADEVDLRVALITPGNKIYQETITMPREGYTVFCDLLPVVDRVFENP